MKQIVIASNNSHKITEIQKILKIKLLSLSDIGFYDEIVEDGNSFEENALIKAKIVSEFLKSKNLDYDVISDDSGLCCNSLNLELGINSARYAGDHDDSLNRKKLIQELKNKDKTAYFICDMVIYHINGEYHNFIGKTYGKIIEEERGTNGFGYDCIFLSDDLNKTFAEVSSVEKNKVSHRNKALKKLKEYLNNL